MVLEAEGRPLRGEALRLGTVVNTMVGQLNGFASEVSRVARKWAATQARRPGAGPGRRRRLEGPHGHVSSRISPFACAVICWRGPFGDGGRNVAMFRTCR